eukprot:4577025-Pyramimonas_sp.AAC.1
MAEVAAEVVVVGVALHCLLGDPSATPPSYRDQCQPPCLIFLLCLPLLQLLLEINHDSNPALSPQKEPPASMPIFCPRSCATSPPSS